MTLVAVWIRKNATLKELVFASDSRLSGGESWDACPKVVQLPRPATALAMSGDATEAYAFLLQGLNTCGLLDGHQIGRTDIGGFAKDLKEVFQDSRRHVSDLPKGEKAVVPTLDVVLGGWSWRRLQFEAFSYSYDKHGQLSMRPLADVLDGSRTYGAYFAGDAAPAARKRLKELLKEKDLPVRMSGPSSSLKETGQSYYLDWEPLEVLLEMIEKPAVRTVGGTPQVLKITQNGQTESFVWRTADGEDSFGGRKVLKNERFDRRILTRTDGSLQISHSDRSISFGKLMGTDRVEEPTDDVSSAVRRRPRGGRRASIYRVSKRKN
ncbi:hypothetical protein [Pseudarthrobacter siccitolerans]